jgi:predicted chitinase
MTTTPAPKKPPQAPQPANAGLKQLPFAFPFLRKGQGKSEASARFTDEHDIYRLLAEREPSGSYLVNSKGMWHGGIHVTEAGAGQRLDLDAGARSIADGHVIAFRANRTYPISEVAASDSQPPVKAPYSTGFALVRHTMEFPKGTTLTFYSLYMHLMSDEDYANFPNREKPAYWLRQWQVTEFAKDRPLAGRSGRVADAGQQGLRVRKSHPHGEVIGILPQGSSVSIGKREKGWGQVKDLHGATLYPPVAGGFVPPSAALGGWIYLGNENGGPLVKEVMPDTGFDRVVITASAACGPDDPSGAGIPIKAGELIGHLGRYDSLNQGPAGTRMVHLEVFCDDSIKSFIEQGRAWVEHHGSHKEDWAALGLLADPTLLRIAPRTKLYRDHDKHGEGADAPVTDVIQLYSLAELGRDKSRQFTESQPDASLGGKVRWWHVKSAEALGNPIEGWVREYNHASGRVTREFAQKWVDFQYCDDTHDPAHTIFASAKAWVDYASGADVPDGASRSRLSLLMQEVYGALFTKGKGSHAADDLCTLAKTEQGQYPWLMQASSRLIVKHESEWANPAKWNLLIAEVEKQTGPKPQHAEEQKRIERLAWWDEVKAGVPGFPEADVYHIHPIGLAANFQFGRPLITLEMLTAVEPSNSIEYYESILPYLNKYATIYQVNKPKRIAHFLSQAAHESHLRASEEGLNYNPKNMRKTFGCKGGKKNYDPNCDDCKRGRLRDKLWNQEEYYAHNPEHLANYVYANRMGNGGEDSGDGYRYHGRGFIQVTGKDGYQSFQNEHNRRSSDDQQDFVANPDLVASRSEYAVESAFVFWSRNNLNSVSDNGTVTDVTQIVNGGQNGYGDRRGRYNKVAPLLGLAAE